jgi:hypothetical protein
LLSNYAIAEEALTPKATLAGWTRDVDSWNLERALQVYHAQGDTEAKFARSMAEQALAEAKLQRAVRDKWGKDVERAVARAITNDTPEDDEAATEKIDGDHATLTFKEETHLPVLYLVKVDNHWKLEVGAFMRDLGDQLERSRQFLQRSTQVVQTAVNALKENKYKGSDDLLVYLKAEYDKLNSAP